MFTISLDFQEHKTALLLESAQCNTIHGDRLTPADKKQVACDIASSDRECSYTEDALAEKSGVTRQTVNTYISDIRARQKTNRNSTIIRLSRLGWTQDKIAKIVGLSQNRKVSEMQIFAISTLCSPKAGWLKLLIKQIFAKLIPGHPILQIPWIIMNGWDLFRNRSGTLQPK